MKGMKNKMKKSRDNYYVLVFTEEGPVFVTSVDYKNNNAFWKKENNPLKMNKSEAECISLGLNLNGCFSIVVNNPFELITQPYDYLHFNCKFERRKLRKKEEVEEEI